MGVRRASRLVSRCADGENFNSLPGHPPLRNKVFGQIAGKMLGG